MANIHLSPTGSDANNGTTWTLAKLTWSGAVGVMAAGDTLYVDSTFTTAAAGQTITFPGTAANPNRIISGTPDTGAGFGVTALVAGATLASSTTTYTITGSFYAWGIYFDSQNVGSHNANIGTATTNTIILDSCRCTLSGVGSASTLTFGTSIGATGSQTTLQNTSFKFAAAGQSVSINGTVYMLGGNLVSGGTSPTTFFKVGAAGRAGYMDSIGFDFTNCSAGVNLTQNPNTAGDFLRFADFKLPASFSGVPMTGTILSGTRAEFYAGDNSTGTNRYWIYDYQGTEIESSSIYLTGTSVDGINSSGKITSTANVKYPMCYKGRWLYAYDAGAGSAKTATIQCARDGSATIYNNNEVWIEVECLGTSGTPLGVFTYDSPADIITSSAAQSSSGSSWTGLGGTNCKFSVDATYTPRNAGYVRARVCAAIPSSGTVYYDPVLTLT